MDQTTIMELIKQLPSIDFSLIAKMLGMVAITYSGLSVNSSYKLHKDLKVKKDYTFEIPLDVKRNYNDNSKPKVYNQKIGEALINFAEVLEKEIPAENLNIFYNNFHSLIISQDNFDISNMSRLTSPIRGCYIPSINEVIVSEKKYSLSIDHELMHMASSIFDETSGRSFVGFAQEKDGNHIGFGLTEGYTQLLTERYFGKKKKILDAYPIEKSIAQRLEVIIGQKKMEPLFFKADLYNLVKELKKYNNEEDIRNFIGDVDLLNKHAWRKSMLPSDKKIMNSRLKSTDLFLLKTCLKKLNFEKQNGIITAEELQNNVQSFLLLFEDKKIKYSRIANHELNEIVQDYFNNLQNNVNKPKSIK